MVFLTIDDPEDCRLAPFRDVRERDLVGRQGLAIVEGATVLRRVLALGRHRPLAILLAAGREGAWAASLAALPESVPVYLAPQPVMDRVTGFHIHRGVLALIATAPLPDAGMALAALPDAALVLVALGIGNHDNLGGLCRNAAAFGCALVLLDEGCCDPFYRKAIRVSAGAALEVPLARGTQAALPDLLAAHGVRPLALTPAGARDLRQVAPGGRVAVIVGAEGPGLPPDLIARWDGGVRIAMAPGFDSLNVATAAAIALHWLAAIH